MSMFNNVKATLGDTEVQSFGALASIMALVTYGLGAKKTGAQIRDAIDDIMTAVIGPMIVAVIQPFQRLLPASIAESLGLGGVAIGAFTGIGDQIAAFVLPSTVLADDEVIDNGGLVRVVIYCVGVVIAVQLLIPVIKEALEGVAGQTKYTSQDAGTVMNWVFKFGGLYAIAGTLHAFYSRLYKDANSDGIHTEAEFDAIYTAPTEGADTRTIIAKLFAPVATIVKTFVAAIFPFEKVEP